MLKMEEAITIAKKKMPEGRLVSVTPLGELFVFVIFGEEGSLESEMDPYYSVNKSTKEFKEFSLVKDTTPSKFLLAFQKDSIEL